MNGNVGLSLIMSFYLLGEILGFVGWSLLSVEVIVIIKFIKMGDIYNLGYVDIV